MLQICNTVTRLVLICHNVTTTSLSNVATALSNIVPNNFFSKKLATSKPSHKKWKDSLEGSLVLVLFTTELELS